MFQILEFTVAHLATVTPRSEKHGDEDKPAVSIRLRVHGLKHDARQHRPQTIDSLELYRALCDAAAEANAVDTVIGRPEVLAKKLRAIRDLVGGISGNRIAAQPAVGAAADAKAAVGVPAEEWTTEFEVNRDGCCQYIAPTLLQAQAFAASEGAWAFTIHEVRRRGVSVVPAAPATHPSPAVGVVLASEPLFWYRPCRDGLYEGPHHHNSVGGKMRREEKPGEWVPLYANPSAPTAGYALVPMKKIRTAYTQAKLAADCIVGFAKDNPGKMCGWLDDACSAADIAADELKFLATADERALSAAPSQQPKDAA